MLSKAGLAKPNSKKIQFWSPIVLLWTPSLIWVLRDAQIWPWDQAFYADSALNLLHSFLSGNTHQWLNDVLNTTPSKPPLLVWLEQIPLIFLPLVHSAEKCLLIFQLAICMSCIYVGTRILQKVGLTTTTCYFWALGLSGNLLFIGLSHQNFVEPLQLLSLLLTINNYLSLKKQIISFPVGLLRFLYFSAFAATTKTTTPVLISPFICLSLFHLFRSYKNQANIKNSRQLSKIGFSVEFVIATTFVGMSTAWYERNINHVIEHLKFSVQPDPIYATGFSGWSKISYWASIILGNSQLLVFSLATLIVLIVAQMIFCMNSSKEFGYNATNSKLELELALAVTALIGFITAVYADNGEARFLLVGVGAFALLNSVIFSRVQSKTVRILLITFLALGALLNQTNTLSPRADRTGVAWNVAYRADRTDIETARSILRRTCMDDGLGHAAMLGVDLKSVNPNSWNFLNHQLAFEKKTSYYCNIFGINYASKSVKDEKLKIIDSEPQYFITLKDNLLKPEILDNSIDLNYIAADLKKTLIREKQISKVADYSNGLEIFKFSNK
jgi:hypothetical protein